MNKEEKLAYLRGKKQVLKDTIRVELKYLKDKLMEEIRIINMEIEDVEAGCG